MLGDQGVTRSSVRRIECVVALPCASESSTKSLPAPQALPVRRRDPYGAVVVVDVVDAVVGVEVDAVASVVDVVVGGLVIVVDVVVGGLVVGVAVVAGVVVVVVVLAGVVVIVVLAGVAVLVEGDGLVLGGLVGAVLGDRLVELGALVAGAGAEVVPGRVVGLVEAAEGVVTVTLGGLVSFSTGVAGTDPAESGLGVAPSR